jgi:hypothetical protein
MRRRLVTLSIALFLCAVLGCSDRYSQHRIKMREDHMRSLAGDVGKLEKDRRARLREVGPSLKKWWHDDVTLFQERAPTAGDYIY